MSDQEESFEGNDPFGRMPMEVIVMCFSSPVLSCTDLFNLKKTCRKFHDVLSDMSFWLQRKLCISLDGHVKSLWTFPPYIERIQVNRLSGFITVEDEAAIRPLDKNPHVNALHLLKHDTVSAVTWDIANNVHAFKIKKLMISFTSQGLPSCNFLGHEFYDRGREPVIPASPPCLELLYVCAIAPKFFRFMVARHHSTLKHVTIGLKYTSMTAEELRSTAMLLQSDCTLQVILNHSDGNLCLLWKICFHKRFEDVCCKVVLLCLICDKHVIFFPNS